MAKGIEVKRDALGSAYDDIVSLVCMRLPLLPSWVQDFELDVCENADYNAQVSVDLPYRRVVMYVGHRLLNMSPRHADEVIVHEFCHCYTCPVDNAYKDAIGVAWPDETAGKAVMSKWISQACEGATEDLARLILRLVPFKERP